MIRVSEESFDRITELSYQLDISKRAVIDMLVDVYFSKRKQFEYEKLDKPEKIAKALSGKKIRKV